MGQKMWYRANFGVRLNVVPLVCISCWLLGTQIETTWSVWHVWLRSIQVTMPAWMSFVRHGHAQSCFLRKVEDPSSRCLDGFDTKNTSSIWKLKSGWFLFFWNLRKLKSSRWGLLKENIWVTFKVIFGGFCDMLKLQGCDQFWSCDQCLCRKEAVDEGQRFDGVWKVSTFNATLTSGWCIELDNFEKVLLTNSWHLSSWQWKKGNVIFQTLGLEVPCSSRRKGNHTSYVLWLESPYLVITFPLSP